MRHDVIYLKDRRTTEKLRKVLTVAKYHVERGFCLSKTAIFWQNIMTSRGVVRTLQTPNIESSATPANGFYLLIIVTKLSILDVYGGPGIVSDVSRTRRTCPMICINCTSSLAKV